MLFRSKKSVAVPGTSEHATGLAVDIISGQYTGLDDKQGDTAEQEWLMAHCQEYGFILRFPKDKSNVTGIVYEPWHYRYVGKEAAKKITEQGITLEEYLQADRWINRGQAKIRLSIPMGNKRLRSIRGVHKEEQNGRLNIW
mgnify:CR=1 FL=1